MNKAQAQKITTCEMRCLRKVTNNTRRDRITNASIREKVGTRPCLDYIEQTKNEMVRPIRMQPDHVVYITFYNINSRRKARGRPRKRWIDGVAETCHKLGKSITQVTHEVQNKHH